MATKLHELRESSTGNNSEGESSDLNMTIINNESTKPENSQEDDKTEQSQITDNIFSNF